MNKKQKINLIRILVSAFLMILFSRLPLKGAVRFIAFLIPYLIVGYDVLKKAVQLLQFMQIHYLQMDP